MINVMPNFTPVVASLCRMYGKQVQGGYELFIPAHILGDLSPTGQVQQQPDNPAEPGVRLRYLPNRIIEGKFELASEPAPPEVVAPLPAPVEPIQHIDEWA